jgi:F0F1-type ATP synthase assembly protein I
MKKAADHPTTKSASGSIHLSLRTVALDLLDTAWRIAVPVILFASAGIFVDQKADSAPWFTLLGTLLGFVVAGYLLKQQLQAVEREEKK